jgi:hypothetical protein
MQGYHDLVAGEGTPGYQDGPFYDALFQSPRGLAISPDGKNLYVSDQGNYCVRLIDLDKGNQVSTLAGTGKPGFTDGSLDVASFNRPSVLVCLPNRQIAVWDDANVRIRLIDLNQKIVSTLAGNGLPATKDGFGNQSQIASIWDMAYLPSQNALYFSQPDNGALRKIDLKTRKVTTVFLSSAGQPLAHPGALCAADGNLYIADRQEAQVYELKPKTGAPARRDDFVWTQVANVPSVISLAWSDGSLYGLKNDPANPVARLWPNPHLVTFISPWSSDQTQSPQNKSLFADVQNSQYLPLVADPTSDRKFYTAQPSFNFITSFRDLSFDELKMNESINSAGLMDFEYPYAKPEKTYRILIMGDSHLYHDYHNPVDTQNRMELTAKRLEFMLNTEAALDEVPLRFEVLTMARPGGEKMNRWIYYEAPPLVQKYDIDMVLIELTADFDLGDYYQRHLTSEGIPEQPLDPEFLTSHWPKKSNNTISEKFLELCLTDKLATINNNGLPEFSGPYALIKYPEVRNDMIEMFCRGLRLLHLKLVSMRTKGGAPFK